MYFPFSNIFSAKTFISSKRFVDIHEKGERVHPSKPGFIIAALAASQRSMKNLSGQFINWTDGERLGLYHEQR